MYDLYKKWFLAVVKRFRRMTLQKRITPKQISRLPLKSYSGEIEVVSNEVSASQAVKNILQERVLGFDIESKPAFRKGEFYLPSLMQIATKDKVYLFQLPHVEGLKWLKVFLEDAKITKVGAGVRHDIVNLQKLETFSPQNFCDLGDLSHRLGVVQTGLRNLAGIFLKERISKSSQLTDWSNETLTPQQIVYAATDAWVSREIFFKMSKYF